MGRLTLRFPNMLLVIPVAMMALLMEMVTAWSPEIAGGHETTNLPLALLAAAGGQWSYW